MGSQVGEGSVEVREDSCAPGQVRDAPDLGFGEFSFVLLWLRMS